MQAAGEKPERRPPPAGDNRRSNADRKKKVRQIEPVEGAQTGSEGLGYLKKEPQGNGKKSGGRQKGC